MNLTIFGMMTCIQLVIAAAYLGIVGGGPGLLNPGTNAASA